MGTATLRLRSIAHRLCQCGFPYSRTEFNALPHRPVTVDGAVHEVRACSSCGSEMGRLVWPRPVDDVD